MAAPPPVRHKVGDTFLVPSVYCTEEDGEPVDLRVAGIAIDSVVRTSDGASHPLALLVLDQDEHRGCFELVGETDAWAVGPAEWDVQFTSISGIESSDTYRILVLPDVTPRRTGP